MGDLQRTGDGLSAGVDAFTISYETHSCTVSQIQVISFTGIVAH